MTDEIITPEYLKSHPDEIFVFGDNHKRVGLGGAAALRYLPNVYGFITKWKPDNDIDSFYPVNEYEIIYEREIDFLIRKIEENPDKTFLISRLGAGLANKFLIFEKVIEPHIKKDLSRFPNVRFLW